MINSRETVKANDKSRVFAITGTPGVGKTSVAEMLRSRGYTVYSFNELAKKLDCIIDYEDECAVVDLEKLNTMLNMMFSPEGTVVVEGHLSHHIADTAIVLRCNPIQLKERLLKRGWKYEKVMENVEAELIDSILVEALEMCERVYEIDTTEKSVEEVAKAIISIIEGDIKNEIYKPGNVDWISELEEKIDEIIRL
jgi:adenylate kinase